MQSGSFLRTFNGVELTSCRLSVGQGAARKTAREKLVLCGNLNVNSKIFYWKRLLMDDETKSRCFILGCFFELGLCSLMFCTYPYQVTNNGCALDINWSRKRFKPELNYSPSTTETLHTEQKSTENSLNEVPNSIYNKELPDEGTLYEMNLNHPR